MRKFLLFSLCLTFLLSASLFILGCNDKTKHTHAFTAETATKEYLCSKATCTEKAKYYYSCSCGEKGTETFDYGKPLGHEFTNYISDNNATYEKDGTKTARCDRKGCTATNTITDAGSKLESKMSFKTLSVNGDKVYGKVSNDTETFSFINEVEYSGLIKYFVSFDINGNKRIDTKTIVLKVGDNKVYVTELLNDEPKAVFEVTIRRRPLYTVSFNANGGTAVNSQTVEEDSFITAPVTTRAGYTFSGWSYDFTQPITKDVTISANWSANTDTAYKVEYYLENLEDNNYTLYEAKNLQGTTDTTATAEIKTYDHFTFYENNSILRGNVSGNGSLVLKVYYTRNTYTLSNANTYYGEITNAVTKKYGSNITSVATEYLGCEFVGWYSGEELLSIAKEYTFTIENNVTAKFKVKDEMSNFNFSSSVYKCNITGLKDKTVSEIIIPDYVTSIGNYAFRDCSGLTSVTIGSGVTSIGSWAFDGCIGLTSVIWNAENCTTAGPIFSNCSKLTNVTIGENVKIIPDSAFKGCNGLTSVTIPNSVTSIGDWTFNSCSSLTSITIPDSVTSIGDSAFSGCRGLTSITIPDSVTSIGNWAFSGCSGLTSVTIGNGVTSIGASAFEDCSGLTSVIWNAENCTTAGSYSSSYSYLIFSNCSKLTNVTIGENVKIIPAYAFRDCSGLTSVTIPDSVTSIGNFAFYNCRSLTSVTIGGSVTSIGYQAFRDCSGLTSVTIPDSVTSIGEYAFYNCRSLTSVTIGNGVTSIGKAAFEDCNSLVSITLPFVGASKTANRGYDEVFGYIFGYVETTSSSSVSGATYQYSNGSNYYHYYIPSSLKTVILSDSVTSIGNSAFRGCNSLVSITLPFVGASKTASDGYDEVFGYIFGYTTTSSSSYVSGATYQYSYGSKYYHYYIPSSLKTVILSDSVTSIGYQAFYNCSGLASVTIPDSVTSIGSSAFNYCDKLIKTSKGIRYVDTWVIDVVNNTITTAEIKDGTKGIASSAFRDCSALTSVTIPDSVTSIGGSAFSDCSGLTSVAIGNGVTSIGEYAFRGCYKLVEVINKSSLNITKGSSNNGYIAGCALNVKKDGTSDIVNKSGYLFYTYDSVNYLLAYTGSNTDLTLPTDYNGQNYKIYKHAFYYCSGLTSVTIGNGVTSIGSSAFEGCSGLTSVTIPDSVTSIGSSAFEGCSGLTSVTIGNGVTSIGWRAFSDCSSLTSVTIPDSVTSIGDRAFYNCSGLASVTIPDSVRSIDSWTFSGCSGLTSVTIPDSVRSIDSWTFSGCSGLTSVTIPNSVTYVGSYAFSDCSGLTSVTIPDSVTSIGDYAFRGCYSLASITLPFVGASKTANSGYDEVFGYIFGYETTSNSSSVSGSTYQYNNGSNYYHYYIPASLKTVILSDSVTSIGNQAFRGCNSLESITLPFVGASRTANSGYNEVFGYIFGYETTSSSSSVSGSTYQYSNGSNNYHYYIPTSLKTVILSDSVTSIGNRAFYNCSGLKCVTIGDGVTSIGERAFYNCSGLTSVIWNAENCTTAGSSSYPIFSNCSKLTNVTIGENVKIIPNYAFRYCYGLTSVAIPNSVTSIGEYAFNGCSGLTSVTIPNSVISIGSSAFSYCSGLTSVTIGDGVTSIGDRAFYNCSGLTSVIWNAENCTTAGSSSYPIFSNCLKLTNVTIGENAKIIPDYAFNSCSSLTSVTIPNSVTSVGSGAFRNCNSLKSITLPFVGASKTANSGYDEVFGYIFGYTTTSRGTSVNGATYQYSNGSNYYYYYIPASLKTVILSDSVTSIGDSAFYNCSDLTSVIWNAENCTTAGSFSYPIFSNCSKLTNVTIGENVKIIPDYAFRGCSGLTSVTIGNSVTSIGSGAFYDCSRLTSVTIPDSVTSIGSGAFYNCSRLTSVTIGNSVTSIGESAFYNCSRLTSVTIPGSVTSIGSGAFRNCGELRTVYYKGKAEQWGNISIDSLNNSNLTGAARYYYSESEPSLNAEGTAYDGNYWHYDADGVTPVIWKKKN